MAAMALDVMVTTMRSRRPAQRHGRDDGPGYNQGVGDGRGSTLALVVKVDLS